MKNFGQKGDILTFVAPGGGVVSGTVYQIEETICVATHDAAAGAEFSGLVEGVVGPVPKLNTEVWATGDLVYWDNPNSRFTNVGAVGIKRAGIAAAPAANPSTTGFVKLHGVAVPNGV
jgi:predicted RecA/RadA family phage recombinase